MHVARLLLFGGVAALVLGGVGRVASAGITYTIEPVPAIGGNTSSAVAINDAGIVTGGAEDSSGAFHPILFDGNSSHDIGLLSGASSGSGTGINNSSTIVGTDSFLVGPHTRGFIRAGSEPIDVGTLGGDSTDATHINNAGQVTGGSSTASGGYHAFLFEQLQLQDLGTLDDYPGATSVGNAINADGTVVGTSVVTDGFSHAFVYINGKLMDLGTLGGKNSEAFGINTAGEIVGHAETKEGEQHAFRYSAGLITDLGLLDGTTTSSARDINDAGRIIGFASGATDVRPRGFLFADGKMHDLLGLAPDANGWSGLLPTDINNKGQIVGTGLLDGQQRGFVMTVGTGAVVPLPSPLWGGALLLAGAGIVIKVHKQMKRG